MRTRDKIQEWGQAWPLPIVAMFGITGNGLFAYSSGVFMDQMVREFGWTKTFFSSALIGSMLVCIVMVPFVGRAVDAFGPRRMALIGILPAVLGMSVLGLANGQLWQWWLRRRLITRCTRGVCK